MSKLVSRRGEFQTASYVALIRLSPSYVILRMSRHSAFKICLQMTIARLNKCVRSRIIRMGNVSSKVGVIVYVGYLDPLESGHDRKVIPRIEFST